jgi:hypothetical protein
MLINTSQFAVRSLKPELCEALVSSGADKDRESREGM